MQALYLFQHLRVMMGCVSVQWRLHPDTHMMPNMLNWSASAAGWTACMVSCDKEILLEMKRSSGKGYL